MSETNILIILAAALFLTFIIWKYIKPYILKYDTTLFLTGGLGSGKTLTAVKTCIVLIRKMRLKVRVKNYLTVIQNAFLTLKDKYKLWKHKKEFKGKSREEKLKLYAKYISVKKQKKKLPYIYSNIPIRYNPNFLPFHGNKEYSKIITPENLLLLDRVEEYSIVFIDEMPQFISQFDWNDKKVQDNFTEFITLFRHYVGGYFIATAQSTSEIVAPLRRKANQATWCFNHKKHLFGLFYTMECCDIMLSDDISTTSTTQISDNTRKVYGLYPHKAYETRCYKNRYLNIPLFDNKNFKKLFTNKVLRLRQYISPCDDETTEEQRLNMRKKAKERK